MNSSMFTADRMTHLKIVVVSLVCATIVAGIGITARISDTSASLQVSAPTVKAGQPITSATRDGIVIR